MSKQKQNIPPTVYSTKVETPASKRVEQAIIDYDKGKSTLFRKIFYGAAAAVAVLMVVLSLKSGINGDDFYQDDYSDNLVKYYASMGRDTSYRHDPASPIFYYGGGYEFPVGVVNHALGLTVDDAAYHDVRHVFNALLGFLAMLFTALIVSELAGWRAALITLLLAFLSPRFLGDSFMNPKDIPFATGYIAAIYYLILYLKNIVSPKRSTLVGLALGIGFAMSVRVGGLLLIAYLFLFLAIQLYLQKRSTGGIFKDINLTKKALLTAVGVSAAAYVFAILFWPYGLANPIKNPLKALAEFSKFSVNIRLLFMGENNMSDTMGWDYPLQWIGRTVPIAVLVGFLGSIVLITKLLRRFSGISIFVLFFVTFFPLFYIIYKKSNLYDSWRHLIFIYPTMVALAALAWVTIENSLSKNKFASYSFIGLLALLSFEPAYFIATNSAYPYVYFNPLGGGIKKAFGNFETDYWGVSCRQGVEWLDKQGFIKENMTDTVTIMTNFGYNVEKYVKKKYGGKVRTVYSKYDRRYEQKWDYALFQSRFSAGSHLRNGTWPERSRTIHTIDAAGVPLLAVMKNTNNLTLQAEAFVKKQQLDSAAVLLREEIKNHADNDIAWNTLSSVALSQNNIEEAKIAAENTLKLTPENMSAMGILGMSYLRANDVSNAQATFQKMVKLQPDYAVGHYYLAVTQQNTDINLAIKSAQKSIQASPSFKAGYELLATLYEKAGNPTSAAQYREAATRMK